MGIDRVSQSRTAPPNTRGLHRAVDLAMKHVTKVQSRITEELRAEDAIRGISVHGTEVHVQIDERHGYKKDGLRDLVKELLAKNGATGVRVELYAAPDAKGAVDKANAAIDKIQARLTRDLRVEDGITNLSLRDDGTVAVVLKAHQPYSNDQIGEAVKRLLADAGLKNATLDFIRPAIQPIPRHVVVQRAMDAVSQVQQRLTADMRAEDDIVGMSLDQQTGDVRVALRAHPHFNDDDIKTTALRHLEAAGFRNANISFIKPAVNPFGPGGGPMIHPTRPGSPAEMKQQVEKFAAEIKTVQSRMTEEIRIEDAVRSVKIKGAKVEITIVKGMATDVDSVKAWAKKELKDRGVKLPITFKAVDP